MRSRRGSRFCDEGSRGSASAPNSVRRGPRSRSASMGCAIRLRVARGDGPRSSWCARAAPSRPASRRTAALVLTLRLAARRPRRLPLGCSWAAPPAVGWPRARCDVHWSQMSSKTSPPRPNRFHCTMGAADPDLSRASRSPRGVHAHPPYPSRRSAEEIRCIPSVLQALRVNFGAAKRPKRTIRHTFGRCICYSKHSRARRSLAR